MKKIYIAFALLIVMWFIYFYLTNDVYITTISWGITSAMFLAFPIIYILSKKAINERSLKKLSFWNSFTVVCICFFHECENFENQEFIYIIGAIIGLSIIGLIYYFINYCLYSKDTREKNYVFVCENCGTKVNEDDEKCPGCGELFKEETEKREKLNKKKRTSSKTNIDQKYSDLTKLKKLLDKEIITKEEFEKEKKKILKN